MTPSISLVLERMVKCFSLKTLLCFSVILLCSTSVYADQQAELKQLQANIAKLQKELKDVQGTRSKLQQDLQKSESEMGELLKKVDKIQQDMQEQNKQLEQLNKNRNDLQEARQQQQSQIATQVQVAYQLGQQSQLKLLLMQESPERISRLMAYHQLIFKAQSKKLAAYLATLNELNTLEPKIIAQQDRLKTNQLALHQQQQALSKQQQQRQTILASLNRTIKNKDDELRQSQEDRQRLQALLQQVAQTLGKVSLPPGGVAFSSRKGLMPWPTKGRVASRFGSSRSNGQMPWNGMLISAKAGQPVIAIHHGRVVFADYFRGHGLLLIIDHGEGYLSLYAHNQSLFKTTGDWVQAGDAIASVGNTGGQEQSALYFEIRQQGKPTDPSLWLARA